MCNVANLKFRIFEFRVVTVSEHNYFDGDMCYAMCF